jgi:hypothetical protein
VDVSNELPEELLAGICLLKVSYDVLRVGVHNELFFGGLLLRLSVELGVLIAKVLLRILEDFDVE